MSAPGLKGVGHPSLAYPSCERKALIALCVEPVGFVWKTLEMMESASLQKNSFLPTT